MKRLSRSSQRSRRAGFTMIEMIIVLLVLAALAAFVMPSTNPVGAQAVGEMNVLRAHIRFAQLRAMGDDGTWGLNIGSNSYTLEQNGSTASNYELPGSDTTHSFGTQGLTVSPIRIAFDTRGRPVNPTSDPANPTVLTADQTITPSVPSYADGPGPIVITEQTGFLQ